MSYVIYVLMDPNKKNYNIKVGKHSGTLNELKSRYRTYHPNHVILLFIETNNASTIEDNIKKELYHIREINDKGNRSEWYGSDMKDIIEYILDRCIIYLKEYSWAYNALCNGKYYSIKAMEMMIKYIKRTYSVRYEYTNKDHGYSLSKNKTLALCYACYNIVSENKIAFEFNERYESHVRDVIEL